MKCYVCKKATKSQGPIPFCKKCEKRVCEKLPLFVHGPKTDKHLDEIIKVAANHIRKEDKRKYAWGRDIKSLNDLAKTIDRGKWVIIQYGMGRNKPTHPDWVRNMQFDTVKRLVEQGRIMEAKEKRGGTNVQKTKKRKHG